MPAKAGSRSRSQDGPGERGEGLLSLARRPGQKIRIGENIVLIVREIRGRQVKLGIEAPAHVRVLREEIYEDVAQANQEAARESTLPEALVRVLKGGA
jgi:carbon storage regulator